MSLGQDEQDSEKDEVPSAVFWFNAQARGFTLPPRLSLLREVCCWEEKRAQVQWGLPTST